MKMHDGEADIDACLVRKLVASQFPELAGLPVTEFTSTGTVNAIYGWATGCTRGCRGCRATPAP